MENLFNFYVATYLCVAAIMDIRLRKISNRMILSGLIISTFLCILMNRDFLQSLLGFILPLPLMLFYRLKKIGAADIKLLSVAGLSIGFDNMYSCLPWIVLFALFLGAYSIAKAIRKHQFPNNVEAFPLAVAIALGTIAGIMGGNRIWEVFWQYVI